jgi:hypothetical protein
MMARLELKISEYQKTKYYDSIISLPFISFILIQSIFVQGMQASDNCKKLL